MPHRCRCVRCEPFHRRRSPRAASPEQPAHPHPRHPRRGQPAGAGSRHPRPRQEHRRLDLQSIAPLGGHQSHLRPGLLRRRPDAGRGLRGRGEGGVRGDRAPLRARCRLHRPQEGRPRHPAGEDRHQARERLQPRRGAARRRQAPRLLRGRGVLRGPDHPDRREVQRRRRAPDLQHRRGPPGHHRQDRLPRQQGADRLRAQGRDGDEGAPVLHPARQGAAAAAGHRRRPPPRPLQRLRLHPGPDRVDRHRHRPRGARG